MSTRREGQFLVSDFYFNAGGLNTADSPFVVDKTQAVAGKNFDYIQRGGIRKRPGHPKLNTVANTELRTLGLGLWDKPESVREVIRAAGTKLQNFDFSAYTFTNLTEDTTAASSDFLPGTSTQPVVFSMYNTATNGVLWGAGGGMTKLYGAYSDAKVTANGVAAPTASSFTATPTGSGGTLAVGAYYYTLVYRKASTQALSNGTVEASATVTSGQKVDLAWTLTNNDTTKYDKIYIYRSSVGGASSFTAGALVAIVNSSVTAYTDTGTVVSSSESVPRAGSAALDNSEPPTSNLETLTLFKRRLVTASGSTVYFSDVNKSESWPTYQTITLPSGGKITGLAVISIASPLSSEIDEVLCVFKQRELWVITGDGSLTGTLPNWSLNFVDNSGSANQSLIVSADGNIAWVNYRGVFMWNGSGKPKYISQPIEDKFQRGGDIDKSLLNRGWGVFNQSRSEIQWCLSSAIEGEQKYVLKLDVRLTEGQSGDALGRASVKGVFTPDVIPFPLYAGLVFAESQDAIEELQYMGDASGFIYSGYLGTADGTDTDIDFEYVTPYLNLGQPSAAKRVHKIVVYILENGVYDLDLQFWANYRYADNLGSNQSLPISANQSSANGVWDVGKWDEMVWDAVSNKVKALAFNLTSSTNDTEGDAFRFKFSQSGGDETVVILGFSVYYTELGTRN
jgi:hypothetical protein